MVLPQRYVNFLPLCHSLVHRDLDHCSLPESITLVHSIHDIALIRPTKQEIAATLNLLVENLCIRKWKIYPTKIQESSTSVKFLGVQFCGTC